jgi:hypothetical protein
MAIFKYTLPSGSTFQLNAPTGTTQDQADLIFYEQVAAGTFVGYNVGDTLTHPTQALQNFGITRLERGTAGVDDQTLLAITAGLPTVATLPTLTSVPLQNTVTQADYIQVNSNPEVGLISQGPSAVGGLSSVETQAIMAQLTATVGQPYNVITQEKGVGKYGFNAQQLERAGYIKPGYAQRYCPINLSTQANPDNFVEFMNSPTPWSGFNNVTSLDNILSSEALQNQIQETLMKQSYDAFVLTGVIIPPSPPPPAPTIGQVYSSNGVMLSASTSTLLTKNIK